MSVTRRQFTASAAALGAAASSELFAMSPTPTPDLILVNGKFTTLDKSNPQADAVAIQDGRFISVGTRDDIMKLASPSTKVIDLNGRRAIPGLIDSHMHIIRGGLNYNMELRWDGVRSLSEAMRMLKEQAARTPAPQWVRVVGGFTEHQFAEKRLPTIEELNAAAPDTPVFILHLYDRAILNGAALRAVGYNKDTPNPPGGEIQRDASGEPTGMLIAKPNAMILYSTLAKGPKLPPEYQVNSTRQFMRELNRLGVTSAIDAGGGFQNYPEDYEVIRELSAQNQLTIRIAYNLFTQKPKEELADFKNWTGSVQYRQGDDFFRHNGAGEMLVFSAADFEDFRQPRPDMPPEMEGELEEVVRILAQKLSEKLGQQFVIENRPGGQFNIGAKAICTRMDQADLVRDTSRRYIYWNFAPQAGLNLQMKKNRNIWMNYNGQTQQPSIQQLQPIVDNTDPLNLYIGNPALKPSFNHNLWVNMGQFDFIEERGMWMSGGFNASQNAFSSRDVVDSIGRRVYQTVNVNGNYTYNLNGNYNFKIKKTPVTLGMSIGANGSNYINFINGLKNTTKTIGVSIEPNINYYVDKKFSFSANLNFRYNRSTSSIRPDVNTNYWVQEHRMDATIFLPWKLEWETEGNFFFRQKTSVFQNNNNVILWNMSIYKKIGKDEKFRFGITANDILNQNIGFKRDISTNYITEKTYNTYRRYFLVSLRWNFAKNGKPQDF